MSIDHHRATVMQEAQDRAARRTAAPPAEGAPPAGRRPEPLGNPPGRARAPLVPRMTGASLPGVQPGHIVAGIIALAFLVALGASLLAPRPSEGPTLVWPTADQPADQHEPAAGHVPQDADHARDGAGQPRDSATAVSQPAPTPAPTAAPTAQNYLEPVNPAPAPPPAAPAPRPQFVAAPPPAPAAEPPVMTGPVSDLVPIPAEPPPAQDAQPVVVDITYAQPAGATPWPTPYMGAMNGGGGSWEGGRP